MMRRTRRLGAASTGFREVAWSRGPLSSRALWACCLVGLAAAALCARLYMAYGWWFALRLRMDAAAPRKCAVDAGAAANLFLARPTRSISPLAILSLRDTAGASTVRYQQVAAFSDAALANKRAYAEAHGYALVVADVEPDARRPAPWHKLLAARDALQSYDWVMYVDGDALFANGDARVECAHLLDDAYDVVLAEDWGGYNTGVFLIRNSSFSRWLLDAMWRTAVEPNNLARINPYRHELPFEYEQRALHFLAKTPTWTRAVAKYDIPEYADDGEYTAAEIRARIKVVPQCALNGYLVRPRLRRPDAAHAAARYADGDFIVHLAGHKGANKAALFDFALRDLARRGAGNAGKRATRGGAETGRVGIE
ncbi:hypothetical protein M885DRAFT_29345 [Pelagophyceae sp. CCMP2097]|nr:hypothetical protein M885DRAFT_29345 [Pelagophyceae sp. CCMP2097]